MTNYWKKIMYLIFGTVVVFGTDFTLPRWLRDVPTEQVEIGKSGAERETDELCMSRRKNNSIDENFRKEPDYE